MKNYSFSNIANEQSYAVRKSNDFSNLYRHSQLKSSDSNLKIQEIKKKYDTPSRRQRIESLKKSKDYEMGVRGQRQETNNANYQPRQNSNLLKESFAVNRMEKSTLSKNDFDNKDFMNLRPSERDYRRPVDKENEAVFKSRQSQEAMFSKVREIKESIINNNYMRSSNGRSSIASGKHPLHADCKVDGRKEYQPRVENIDKINSKIKQILNCLSENQKNSSKYAKETIVCSKEEASVVKEPFFGVREIAQSKKSYQSHFQKDSDVVEKINISDPRPPQEPTSLEPSKSFINQSYPALSRNDQTNNSKSNIEYPPRFKSREYSVNRVEPAAVPRCNPKEEEIVRTPNNYQKDSNELRASRSKSQIDSIRKSSLGGNDNGSVLKSGKKVNDEISKIQRKIEEFQKEKRKLNIEFTPFSVKNKSTANLNASLNCDRPSQPVGPGIKKIEQSRESIKNIIQQRSSSYDIKFKSYMNRASNYQQQYSNLNKSKDILSKEVNKNTSIYENVRPKGMQDGDFELKIQQIEVKTVRIDKDADNNEEENINQAQQSAEQAALKKRTDDGIEERRRRWKGEEPIITTEVLKNIVRLFCEQVKLDQHLRNLKIWLESIFESNKFSKLMQLLQRQGVKLDLQTCKSLFTVDQSQNNPFFSVQSFEGNHQLLISAYLQAQRHWETKIQHKFDKSCLTSQGFTSQKIDLQRKGFIQLQDLVRFLNIQSGTFFRNRDLFLIFRRLTPTDRVNFQSMLLEICG